jgi:hypothetical protein
MKRTYRLALAVASASCLVFGASQALAQQLSKQIVGGWTLVSAHNEKDGKKTEPFGSQPQGYLTFSEDGRFSFQIYGQGMKKFAANERMKATPDEAQSVVHNSIAYFGTYKLNDDGTMDWKIEQSTFPNQLGRPAKRQVKISGDELTLTNPGATAGGTNIFVWKRAK